MRATNRDGEEHDQRNQKSDSNIGNWWQIAQPDLDRKPGRAPDNAKREPRRRDSPIQTLSHRSLLSNHLRHSRVRAFSVKCLQLCRRASILVPEYESIRDDSRVCKLRRSPRYRLLGSLLLVDAPNFTTAKYDASRVAASGPKHRSGVERGTRDPQGTPSYGAKNRRERRSGQGIDPKLTKDGTNKIAKGAPFPKRPSILTAISRILCG